MSGVTYIHLPPGSSPPPVTWPAPFKAVVVIEADVTDDWRDLVSAWLVKAGCLYMMAWGRDCILWDDSVDWASIEASGGEVADEALVMTTWHDDEPLAETFWFAAHCADQGHVELRHALIIDIGALDRRAELLAAYEQARTSDDD